MFTLILTAFLALSMMVPFPALSAVPDSFGVQGILTTPTGDLAPTGLYDLRFSVYAAPGGGQALYVHTATGLSVRRGLYNVILPGDGNTPLYEVFSAPPRFLQVEIITSVPDPSLNGMPPGPRQHLGSVASAFLAARAQASTDAPSPLLPHGAMILWDQPTGCNGGANLCPCGYDEAGEFRGRTIRGADLGGASSDLPSQPGISAGSVGAGATAPGEISDQLEPTHLPVHAHGGGSNQGSHTHRFRTIGATQYLFDPGGNDLNNGSTHRFDTVTNANTTLHPDHNHTVNNAGSDGPHYHPFRSVLFCRRL